MFLTFKDLGKLFSKYRGVKDADHYYLTVANQADETQPRGLFIPVDESSGELATAITNGAIAAIWDERKEIPHYTPNHFPVFITNNPVEAWRNVVQFYFEKIEKEKAEEMEMTKFVFLTKELLKKNKETYDIAVMIDKLSVITNSNHTEGRE